MTPSKNEKFQVVSYKAGWVVRFDIVNIAHFGLTDYPSTLLAMDAAIDLCKKLNDAVDASHAKFVTARQEQRV